ncbi:MAG: sugar-binding domain-containing protein [Anaerolineae bacterium]
MPKARTRRAQSERPCGMGQVGNLPYDTKNSGRTPQPNLFDSGREACYSFATNFQPCTIVSIRAMNTDQLLQIARLYYEQNKTQDEIGQQLLVSRSTVSRALKLAKERGYIRTVVVAPASSAAPLEAWFRARFNLQHVVIVPGCGNSPEVLDSVGQSAATYLDHVIAEEAVLTVAGGRTLFAVSKQVRPTQRPQVTVVPAMGGWVGASAISANEVVREIATRWNAQAEALFAPAIVSDDVARQALWREESIRLTVEKASVATVACVSLAGLTRESNNPQHHYSSSGRISEEDRQYLLNLGAVGESCAQFFDIHGQPIESWNQARTIAISLQDLKRIPVVIMVGAGREKAQAFLGACRGDFITALIITEELAGEIERLEQSS